MINQEKFNEICRCTENGHVMGKTISIPSYSNSLSVEYSKCYGCGLKMCLMVDDKKKVFNLWFENNGEYMSDEQMSQYNNLKEGHIYSV